MNNQPSPEPQQLKPCPWNNHSCEVATTKSDGKVVFVRCLVHTYWMTPEEWNTRATPQPALNHYTGHNLCQMREDNLPQRTPLTRPEQPQQGQVGANDLIDEELVQRILTGTDWTKFWQDVYESTRPELEAYERARVASLRDACNRWIL